LTFEQSLNFNASIDLERLPLFLVIYLPTYKGTRVNTEATEMSAIHQALQKLLQISSPPQGVNVLLQNPELLTDQADNLLVKCQSTTTRIVCKSINGSAFVSTRSSATKRTKGTTGRDSLTHLTYS